MRVSLAALVALLATPAFGEPPKVVVDIAPVHALVAQVMEGVETPQLLLDQGDNPHSVQLKPSQARMLAGADLVIWVGPELSPWLEDIVEMEADDSIALTAHPATYLREFAQPDMDHAHADEADHDHAQDEHAEDAQGGHTHSGVDPHVWLTTRNARAWIDVFADTLAERDPDNADTYRANASRAKDGINALDAEIESRLAAHQGAEIVTFHDAFGYFAEEFGIKIAGAVRPGDASAPSAAALAQLKALVADHGVECAFAEPGHDPGLLDAIAGATGLRIGLLDPTGALQPVGPGHYTATLTAVAEAIAGCLEEE